MSKIYPETVCYMARRTHPILGELLKIGISWNPYQRCKALRAEVLVDAIPYEWERIFHGALQEHRAWGPDATWWTGPHPFYSGYTEWFFFNEDVVRILEERFEVYL